MKHEDFILCAWVFSALLTWFAIEGYLLRRKVIRQRQGKPPVYLNTKTVEYRGYEIFFWVKEDTMQYPYEGPYFCVGWRSNIVRGYYNSGISFDSIPRIFEEQLRKARHLIDKELEKPNILEKVKKMDL